MLISIIIPCLDAPADRLLALLQNICQQAQAVQRETGDGVEVFLVDNGSQEALANNYRELCTRLKVIYLRELQPGSYAARNTGIAASKGELLVFTDDDCDPVPTWLSCYVAAYAKNPASMYCGDVLLNYNSKSYAECHDAATAMDQKKYCDRGGAMTANIAIPRAVFDSAGVFDSSLLSGADIKFTREATAGGVSLGWVEGAEVWHPARGAAGIMRKIRRITGGHLQEKRQSGKTFTLRDYIGSCANPYSVLKSRRQLPFACRAKAFAFSFFVVCIRLGWMLLYQTGAVKEYFRR